MSRREEQRRRTRKQTLAPTITFLPFYHIYPEVNSDPLPFVWAVCTLPPAFNVCIHCTIFSTKRRLATHTTFHPTYSSFSPPKSSTSRRQKHVKFAVKWLPPRRVVATCFIVICRENPDRRISVPCPVPTRLLPSHPPFVRPCRSLCPLCLGLYTTCSSGTFVTVYSVNSCWLHIIGFGKFFTVYSVNSCQLHFISFKINA